MKKILVLLMLGLSVIICAAEETGLIIKEINIVNNVHVPYEVIEAKLVSQKGKLFSAADMIQDYISIKSLNYISDADIYPQIFEKGVKLTIEIKEKENAYKLLKDEGIVPESEREKIDRTLIVKSIEVFGNTNIKSDFILKEVPLIIGGFLSKEKALEGQDKILKTGYFRDVNTEILKRGNGIYVKYFVVENPLITGVIIEGNKLISTVELVKDFETKAGEVYNINILKKDNDNMLEKYRAKGYALTNISSVNMTNDLKIVIRVSEAVVRDIVFKKMVKTDNKKSESESEAESDNLKTKEFVLRRELNLKKGEMFEMEKFQTTMKNIYRLGYFKDIKPEFEKIPEDEDGVNVVLSLDENKSGAFMGSISYGTSGSSSRGGWQGSLGISDNNFLGKAQTIGVNLTIAQNNKRTYELSFSDPWIRGTRKVSLGARLYKIDEEITDDTYGKLNSFKTGFSVNLGREIYENVRGRIGYKIEAVKRKTTYGAITADHITNSITPSLVYDTRNNYLNPTKGTNARVSFEFGKYGDGQASKQFYEITELELKKYHEIIKKHYILAYRGVIGVATPETRETEQFQIGGGNSIRGYENGAFTGKYELYANLENRIPIDDKFQVILFYDMGKTWSSRGDIEKNYNLNRGYGLGIRLDTPLGPIRLDYGWPIGNSENKNGKFYFSMGQMF